MAQSINAPISINASAYDVNGNTYVPPIIVALGYATNRLAVTVTASDR